MNYFRYCIYQKNGLRFKYFVMEMHLNLKFMFDAYYVLSYIHPNYHKECKSLYTFFSL